MFIPVSWVEGLVQEYKILSVRFSHFLTWRKISVPKGNIKKMNAVFIEGDRLEGPSRGATGSQEWVSPTGLPRWIQCVSLYCICFTSCNRIVHFVSVLCVFCLYIVPFLC